MPRPQDSTEPGRKPVAPFAALLCLALHAACAEQPPAAPSPQPVPEPELTPEPAPEAHPLQGTWEGDGDSGAVTLTIAGDSLYFYARPDFQYDATFKLVPDSDPAELHATILDTPRTTDSQGELVVAIYEFEDGALTLAAVDKPEGATASFDNAISRYRLERVQPLE